MVTHETRIREVPGSNPGADQPDWGFFVVSLSYQGKCWVRFSLPRSNWPLFIKFIYLISLSKFNLPLIGTFTWPHATRVKTCRGRELNYGSHTYFFDHTRTWRTSPDVWSAQCRGHLRDSRNMKNSTHQAHIQSSQQDEYEMMMTTVKWYSGTLGA